MYLFLSSFYTWLIKSMYMLGVYVCMCVGTEELVRISLIPVRITCMQSLLSRVSQRTTLAYSSLLKTER